MLLRFLFTLTLALSLSAHAYDKKTPRIHIEYAYAHPTVPSQSSGAAYLSMENKGAIADRLITATSPIAKSVEIHTMSMDGNVMKMREVQNIEIRGSTKILMKPGEGYHLMLNEMEKVLRAGDTFPLTLVFEKTGKMNVSVVVEERAPRK